MKTKWFTNSLAKQSMLNKEGIVCENGNMLFIVGYGALTTSGKNTYNYEERDSNNNVVSSGNDTYLDKLTTIIKGASPKAKANKESETNEANKETKAKKQTKEAKECLYLTFDEAFDKACKMIESYKDIAIILGKYESKDVSLLALKLINEATLKEHQRVKEAKRNEELQALYISLEIAKTQGGKIYVRDGEIIEILPLPIANLMTNEDPEVVIEKMKKLKELILKLFQIKSL